MAMYMLLKPSTEAASKVCLQTCMKPFHPKASAVCYYIGSQSCHKHQVHPANWTGMCDRAWCTKRLDTCPVHTRWLYRQQAAPSKPFMAWVRGLASHEVSREWPVLSVVPCSAAGIGRPSTLMAFSMRSSSAGMLAELSFCSKLNRTASGSKRMAPLMRPDVRRVWNS